MTAKLTILAEEGFFVRESIGSDFIDDEYYGSFSSDSEAMAFRRVCSRFGLGRYLYNSEVIEALRRKF